MNIDYSFFKVSDGQSLAYKIWNKVDTPKGIVIIVHGMAEHIERYDNFATYLNNLGFIVYGTDQRGHGKTSGKKGIFTHDKSWQRVIDDQFEFYKHIKETNKDLDIYYFAHSMGSFITRTLLGTRDVKPAKLILSGTGYEGGIKSKAAISLASLICKVKGVSQDAIFLDNMVNAPFAASVENPLTSFDWLSRDPVEVAKYVNDSNCGFVCSNKFYYDFFNIISVACKKSTMKKMNREMPILLYSGDNDPVGGKNANNVKKLHNIYTKIGLNASLEINKGGRHENINETNREEVYKYFENFLLK